MPASHGRVVWPSPGSDRRLLALGEETFEAAGRGFTMEQEFEDLVTRQAAREHLQNARQTALEGQAVESIAPGDGIRRRTLAADVVAETSIPAADIATMDGFAVSAPVEYPVPVVDAVYPEDDPPSMESGEAVRIATGAPLPETANAVLRSEEATVADGQLTGSDIAPGTYTYGRGSNVREGETLYDAGETLRAADAVLLADLGVDLVDVYAPFDVGVLATGSEIHQNPGTDFDSGMLLELFRAWGARPTYEGTVPDDVDAVTARIEELANRHDVVVTTGGTSVGPKDYVLDALEALGDVVFHRVRIRPGKPLALADLGDAVAIAVPGKPVGAYLITTLVVSAFFGTNDQPATLEATCPVGLEVGGSTFEYAIPVTISGKEARPLGHASSPLPIYEDTFDPSVLSSATRATRADGVVLRDSDIEAGETVTVVPFEGLE